MTSRARKNCTSQNVKYTQTQKYNVLKINTKYNWQISYYVYFIPHYPPLILPSDDAVDHLNKCHQAGGYNRLHTGRMSCCGENGENVFKIPKEIYSQSHFSHVIRVS